ncbi:MAG TPA: hypothetical protein VIM48_03980, partial [Chthoniobacterales bacterium]
MSMLELRTFFLASLAIVALSRFVYAGIGFETGDGFTVGQDVSKSSAWSVIGGLALVADHDAHSGAQSLEIDANATVTYS